MNIVKILKLRPHVYNHVFLASLRRSTETYLSWSQDFGLTTDSLSNGFLAACNSISNFAVSIAKWERKPEPVWVPFELYPVGIIHNSDLFQTAPADLR